MLKPRIVTNPTKQSYMFKSGRKAMVLHPFADRHNRSGSSVCYVVIDSCEDPKSREEFDTQYIRKNYAMCSPPGEIIGVQKCNIHIVSPSGVIEPWSNLAPGLCGTLTMADLREKFPTMFEPAAQVKPPSPVKEDDKTEPEISDPETASTARTPVAAGSAPAQAQNQNRNNNPNNRR